MSKSLTAADRSSLIRLASTLPKGSEERRAILAGLQKAALRAGWAPVRRWMLANWEDYTDTRGEPNMTALAEAAAWEAGRDEWLDDPDHWVWAAAEEIHDMWEKGKLDGGRRASKRQAKWQKGDPIKVESVKPASPGSYRYLVKIKDYGLVEVEYGPSGMATSFGRHPHSIARAAIKAVKKAR